MRWRTRLAALLVVLAVAGCTQGTTGQPAGSNASYPSENNEIRPEHGGGMAGAVLGACSGQRGGDRDPRLRPDRTIDR
jgi:hypothetical protein